MADRSGTTCHVVDFSESEAAVSADLEPELRIPLAVGKMMGRVVRRFVQGFAIQFSEKLALAEVERRLAG